MKTGFVSIVGRPNVGKSTLLNSLLERKIAITSNVSGTTRNIIEGIYNDDESQIIFIDTPGIHKPQNKLGTMMNKKAYTMANDVDIILFLIDASKGFGKGDSFILDKLKDLNKPIFLLMNKVDLIKKDKLLEQINQYKDLYPFQEIIPMSALRGDNVSDIIVTIKKYLNEGEKYYSSDDITNLSRDFLLAEMVREKVLQLTKDEVPHAVTCLLEHFEEDEKSAHVMVTIIIDRENIKKIIIGKHGAMLKEIGTKARIDMEEFLGKKVYLETFVKTIDNWKDQEKYLNELGLNDLD